MKFLLAAACLAISSAAPAAETPKEPVGSGQIDPTRAVKDPRGHAFLPCGPDEPKDCAKDQTLGFFVYLALGAQSRGGAAQPDPEVATRVRLGWRIYAADAPVEISESERVMIRRALFANIQMPNVAYAVCRMIGNPEECDKP